MPKFREGTTDADCWRGIVEGNEYSLPDTLDPYARIIDIGMHVGSFVQAAYNRGARRILAFEADKANYALAYENVGHLDGATLINMAVGRSDNKAQERVLFSGYTPFFDGRTNTGGGHVFAKPENPYQIESMIGCIPFDRIAPSEPCAILKIDCEGSEWPILYTSQTLHRVQRIVGEYHYLPEDVTAELGLKYPCDAQGLELFLRARGFSTVTVQPYNETHYRVHGQKIGLFEACR